MGHLKTSDIAKAIGVHVNTIRLYEKEGLLPPVPRAANGYRVFDQTHLNQARLIRIAFDCPFVGSNIRRVVTELIYDSAAGRLAAAKTKAQEHLRLIQVERRRAESAAEVLKRWVNEPKPHGEGFLSISEVARLLDVTQDMLRNWERNQLITVPRNPENGYRVYSRAEIDRLRVIRLLRKANYSTMSILRIMLHLEHGTPMDVRQALDTPEPYEDALSASDRWLTTLQNAQEQAIKLLEYIDQLIANR